jgi:hypothetical protein
MTCYQVYETITEGTPISPVFESRESLIAFLVREWVWLPKNAAARDDEVDREHQKRIDERAGR